MKTANHVLDAFAYYIGNGGYYEKASAKYLGREVEDFAKNKGSGNYTYMGKLLGCNPAPWCVMMVATAVLEALEGDWEAAKKAMWGRFPHYNCGTLADDARAKGLFHWSWYGSYKKGKTGETYTPKAGDVVIFTDAWKTRDHTGMIYAVDKDYIYTYEGNSGNMARKRSYPIKSAYIYGYAELDLGASAEREDAGGIARFQRWLGVEDDGVYGPITKAAAIKAHQKAVNEQYGLSIAEDGDWGPETYYATRNVQRDDWGDDVYVWQGLLYCLGYDPTGFDGGFGKNTYAATVKLQEDMGLNPTGIADPYTWACAFGESRPAHTTLKLGSTGAEVRYLQERLSAHGYAIETDGGFGSKTEDDVKDFQKKNGLEVDGVVGPATWDKLE